MRHTTQAVVLAVLSLLALLILMPLAAYAQNAPSFQGALSSTQVNIKAQRGVFAGLLCYNPNAAVEYVQVFDSATAVTVGTTTPTFVVPLPASVPTNLPGLDLMMSLGVRVAATTTATGSGAPASALVCTFGVR